VSSTARSDEAVARLLEAWRGEIEARAAYTILAERMRDPRRAVPLTRLSHLASEVQQEIGREAELPSLQACAILL
jgi:hypothetical protein